MMILSVTIMIFLFLSAVMSSRLRVAAYSVYSFPLDLAPDQGLLLPKLKSIAKHAINCLHPTLLPSLRLRTASSRTESQSFS